MSTAAAIKQQQHPIMASDNPFADPSVDSRSVNENPFASSTELPQVQPSFAEREAALNAREAELARREQEIAASGIQPNNWPKWYPIMHHDIHAVIPEQSRALMTRLYHLWLALVVTLIVNIVACVLLLISGASDGAKDMIGAAVYIPFIGIPSLYLWYRPIYYGYAKEHAFFFYLYYIFAGFHILFSVYMVVGIPSTGSAGLINMIAMFAGQHWAAAVLCVLASVGWVIQLFGSLLFYRQIWAHGKAAGQTFEKAKGEVASQGLWAYLSHMRTV
ncbi:Secretory carrier membrane protein [Phaffia rhodozyma]|uniref:Secretory carrier membrane protein n=1 Tax=Phaffia rhodozyma TaxID=264483 RepID=A0A0F7SFR6_PHARH|nr:Secretory carrier membrane protein [Phaffia rhodozyma]